MILATIGEFLLEIFMELIAAAVLDLAFRALSGLFNVRVRCVPALRIDSEVIVPFRLGCWFDGVRQSGGDVPREEFLDAVDGMIGDASQHLV